MKGDKKVIESFQNIAGGLSHLSMQLRCDISQLKVMGLKWLAGEVKDWYKSAECQLDKVNKQILYFNVDPTYDVGKVVGMDSVTNLLQRNQKLVYDLLDIATFARKQAWDYKADYSPDVLEHVLEELEEIAYKIDRELSLVSKLTEPGYIGARLEDQ